MAKVFINYTLCTLKYEDWSISEYLINFQGGFVRRGLIGDLIYKICAASGCTPFEIILPLCIVSFAIFFTFLILTLRRYQLRWWLLAFIASCVFPSIFRKDFLMLLLFMLILLAWRQPVNKALRWLISTAISIVMLLAYEPNMFMCLPIVWMLMWNKSKMSRTGLYTYSALIFLTMCLVTYFKGSQDIAISIHNSWRELLPDEFGNNIGRTIQSLTWNTNDSLSYNESILLPGPSTTSIIGRICLLIFIPWLYISYFYIATTSTRSKWPCTRPTMATIMIFMLICDLPLWLGLSCDYGRLLTMMLLTVIATVIVLPRETVETLMPHWALKVGGAIDSVFASIPLNIYSLTIIMLVFTAPYSHGFSPEYYYIQSIIGQTVRYTADVIQIVLNHITLT